MRTMKIIGLVSIVAMAGALVGCSDDDDNNDGVCGNGVIEGSEACDQDELNSQGCADVGNFTGGTLTCSSTCTFDTSACTTDATCGNGDIDTGEDCDTTNLDNQDCADVGNFGGGTLTCNSNCTFNTSQCTPNLCGNGDIDGTEECDLTNLDDTTCALLPNYDSGDLACNTDCTFDTSSCVPNTSGQIQMVLDAADGASLSLDIDGAWVTYVKPAVGDDVAGFFLQARQDGPAIFIGVDPTTLSPVPVVGDEVSLTVTAKETYIDLPVVTAVTSFTRDSQNNNVGTLVQDVTTATDLVTGLDDYTYELIDVTVEIVTPFGTAGAGHRVADVETTGVTANADLELRLPTTLLNDLGIGLGCVVDVTQTPLWRYDARAQISAWDASEIDITSCPAPQVVSAVSTGDSTVVVTFDRAMDDSTITDVGSQFTFDNGLTASSFTADGADITLVTSAQTSGATYIVTVAATVQDLFGVGVDQANNTAEFVGWVSFAPLVIWEVDANQTSTDTAEFIEIWNNTGSAMNFDTASEKYWVVFVNGSGENPMHAWQLTGTVAADAVLVLGQTGVTGMTIDTTGDDLQNGVDGILLVRCDDCTAASNLTGSSTSLGTAATFTAGGHTATKLDGLCYDTGNGDDADLRAALGVDACWGETNTTSNQRISPTAWTQSTPSPSVK